MAKTSFKIEDAKNLLHELNQFQATLLREWSHVSTQWSNLKETWHDQQFNEFEPLFDKLSLTYDDELKKCENYMLFLRQQIDIAEQDKSKLGNLGKKVAAVVQIGQHISSLASGFPSSEIPTSQVQPVSFIEQQQGAQKSVPITGPTKAEKELIKAWNTSQITEKERRKGEAEKGGRSSNQSETSGSGKPPKKPV